MRKNYHHSKETRKKISEARKGKLMGKDNPRFGKNKGIDHPFYGKHHSEKTKRKWSALRKGTQVGIKNHFYGKTHSKKTKRKLRDLHLGTHLSEETKRKMSLSHRGKPKSEDWKQQASNRYRGENNPSKRREVREKISLWRQQNSFRFSGPNSHYWKGGISFEPHSLSWKETLRRAIRERDCYTCQICLLPQCDLAFSIHHIDYNKYNCNPDNLITLCKKCHGRTNLNRNNWQDYLSFLIKLKYGIK